MPILEVDIYVLEQSKQLLVVLTTLIAHKLTKCHTTLSQQLALTIEGRTAFHARLFSTFSSQQVAFSSSLVASRNHLYLL